LALFRVKTKKTAFTQSKLAKVATTDLLAYAEVGSNHGRTIASAGGRSRCCKLSLLRHDSGINWSQAVSYYCLPTASQPAMLLASSPLPATQSTNIYNVIHSIVIIPVNVKYILTGYITSLRIHLLTLIRSNPEAFWV